jgi:hypothetical protein
MQRMNPTTFPLRQDNTADVFSDLLFEIKLFFFKNRSCRASHEKRTRDGLWGLKSAYTSFSKHFCRQPDYIETTSLRKQALRHEEKKKREPTAWSW